MSHFRRGRRQIAERHDLAVQSEPPSDNPELPTPVPSKSVQLPLQPSPQPKVDTLLQNMSRVHQAVREQKTDDQKDKRSIRLNMMRLQDKQFGLDKNIFNIAVGQIISRENYLSTLNSQIQELKQKIQTLEVEEEHNHSTIQHPLERQQQRSRTIDQRNSHCGRIYSRANTPSASQRRYLRTGQKQSERSSFYKWRPELEQAIQSKSKHLVRPGHIARTQHSSYSQQLGRDKDQEYFQYRVRQSKVPCTPQQSRLTARQPSTQYSPQGPVLVSKTNKTDQIGLQTPLKLGIKSSKHNQSIPSKHSTSQKSKQLTSRQGQQQLDNQKLPTNRSVKTFANKSQVPQSEPEIDNQNNKDEEEVELQPYDGQLFKDPSQWQIKDINDDFRHKISQQLQIPTGFPSASPALGLTLQQIDELGINTFALFGVQVKREPQKMISRKFKNGLYFHIASNKNILWYFSGSFYLGGWDTDLPTEGQKNGFGFEFLPEKYCYIGHFKDGVKQGQGSIKVFSSNPETPQLFMAYEGQWENGKPHGQGKHIDEKNTRYIGTFNAGQKTGRAIILTEDGLLYEGEVKKGLKHGHGLEKLTNGDSYTGAFEDGKFHGQGLYRWKNGSTYEGQFYKGKRQGKGLWRGAGGDEFEGEYHNDLKNGWGRFTWANGQIYEGEFKDDIRHGQGTYRHPSGKLGSFMWKEGKIDYRIYSQQESNYRCRNLQEGQRDQSQEEYIG